MYIVHDSNVTQISTNLLIGDETVCFCVEVNTTENKTVQLIYVIKKKDKTASVFCIKQAEDSVFMIKCRGFERHEDGEVKIIMPVTRLYGSTWFKTPTVTDPVLEINAQRIDLVVEESKTSATAAIFLLSARAHEDTRYSAVLEQFAWLYETYAPAPTKQTVLIVSSLTNPDIFNSIATTHIQPQHVLIPTGDVQLLLVEALNRLEPVAAYAFDHDHALKAYLNEDGLQARISMI